MMYASIPTNGFFSLLSLRKARVTASLSKDMMVSEVEICPVRIKRMSLLDGNYPVSRDCCALL
jgi:hypothetical protein